MLNGLSMFYPWITKLMDWNPWTGGILFTIWILLSIAAAICSKTWSCLQVYLPCVRAVPHEERICSKFAYFPHSTQNGSSVLPHTIKFVGDSPKKSWKELFYNLMFYSPFSTINKPNTPCTSFEWHINFTKLTDKNLHQIYSVDKSL